jgi:hypothetical protein
MIWQSEFLSANSLFLRSNVYETGEFATLPNCQRGPKIARSGRYLPKTEPNGPTLNSTGLDQKVSAFKVSENSQTVAAVNGVCVFHLISHDIQCPPSQEVSRFLTLSILSLLPLAVLPACLLAIGSISSVVLADVVNADGDVVRPPHEANYSWQ